AAEHVGARARRAHALATRQAFPPERPARRPRLRRGGAIAPDHVAARGERLGHGALRPDDVALGGRTRALRGRRDVGTPPRALRSQGARRAPAQVAQAPLGAAHERALERIARHETPRLGGARLGSAGAWRPATLVLAALRLLDAAPDLGQR